MFEVASIITTKEIQGKREAKDFCINSSGSRVIFQR
jgi:hypothetical protein